MAVQFVTVLVVSITLGSCVHNSDEIINNKQSGLLDRQLPPRTVVGVAPPRDCSMYPRGSSEKYSCMGVGFVIDDD